MHLWSKSSIFTVSFRFRQMAQTKLDQSAVRKDDLSTFLLKCILPAVCLRVTVPQKQALQNSYRLDKLLKALW